MDRNIPKRKDFCEQEAHWENHLAENIGRNDSGVELRDQRMDQRVVENS